MLEPGLPDDKESIPLTRACQVTWPTIDQHQAVQLSVGRSVMQLEAARALLYRTAAAGLDRLEPARIGVLKAFATDAASGAISIQGAMGLLDDLPAMQLFQDAKPPRSSTAPPTSS